MAAAADQDLPEFYHFPPFFTLQPVLETRKMQLKLWHDFILKWHQVRAPPRANAVLPLILLMHSGAVFGPVTGKRNPEPELE